MNTRGRHLVNLVKGTEQQQQFESLNVTNDKRPGKYLLISKYYFYSIITSFYSISVYCTLTT